MSQTWVVDANVLYCAAALNGPVPQSNVQRCTLAFEVLAQIALNHSIAEDGGNAILGEYARCWKRVGARKRDYPNWLAAHHFFDRAMQKAHFVGRRSVPAAIRRALQAANMKPDGDIAYVETANATDDKLLVTEDSDFTPEIRTLLASTAGVNIRVVDYEGASLALRSGAAR